MDLPSPNLVRLKETAQQYEIGLYVPAVAKGEWLVFHQELAAKEYDTIASGARTLGKYLGRKPLGN